MKTVLLCEDNEDMASLIKLVVERAGFSLIRAGDGQQAVEMCLKQKPDLVLMDLKMPTMDGHAATKTLRDQGYTKPIIILTASEKEEDKRKAKEAGCNGFILKTLGMAEVESILHRLIG